MAVLPATPRTLIIKTTPARKIPLCIFLVYIVNRSCCYAAAIKLSFLHKPPLRLPSTTLPCLRSSQRSIRKVYRPRYDKGVSKLYGPKVGTSRPRDPGTSGPPLPLAYVSSASLFPQTPLNNCAGFLLERGRAFFVSSATRLRGFRPSALPVGAYRGNLEAVQPQENSGAIRLCWPLLIEQSALVLARRPQTLLCYEVQPNIYTAVAIVSAVYA